MMFCPKCGTILMPKGGKLACVKCGYTAGGDVTIKEQVKHTSRDVHVVEKETEALPLVDAKCKKCGHTKAYHWELQTRSADEPATRFYKCEQCKYTWREYK